MVQLRSGRRYGDMKTAMRAEDEQLIGMNVNDAYRDRYADYPRRVRVVGAGIAVTFDLRPTRCNVRVENDIIVAIDSYY